MASWLAGIGLFVIIRRGRRRLRLGRSFNTAFVLGLVRDSLVKAGKNGLQGVESGYEDPADRIEVPRQVGRALCPPLAESAGADAILARVGVLIEAGGSPSYGDAFTVGVGVGRAIAHNQKIASCSAGICGSRTGRRGAFWSMWCSRGEKASAPRLQVLGLRRQEPPGAPRGR